MTNLKFLFLLLIALLYSKFSVGNFISSNGKPNIINYSRAQYGAGTQNWSIAQQRDGLIYSANNDGLIEYGIGYWKVKPFVNGKRIRSVICYQDRIYVGAAGEFGYYIREKSGELSYTSLSSTLAQDVDYKDEVWRIHTSDEGVYFESSNHIYYYDKENVSLLFKHENIEFSALINNIIYIQLRDIGLGVINNGQFELIPHTDALKERTIRGIFTLPNNELFICTLHSGLFKLGKDGIKPFECSINDNLKRYQIYSAYEYLENYFVLGTVTNGIYVITKSGTHVMNVNRNNGLQNNTILSIGKDQYHNLWLGLDNGISMIELNSPVSFIDSQSGMGTGYVSILYDDKLYMGTNQGLYVTEWSSGRPFNPTAVRFVEGTGGQVWNLQVIDNKLYCGHHRGTFLISDYTATLISNNVGGWQIEHIKDDLYIQNTYYKLVIYKATDGGLVHYGAISDNVVIKNRFIVDSKGDLWCTDHKGGVLRLTLDLYAKKIDHISKFDFEKYGSPTPIKSNNEVVILTNNGIFKYSNTQKIFALDRIINSYFDKQEVVSNLYEDQFMRLWFISNMGVGYITNKYGHTEVMRESLLSISGRITWNYNVITVIDTDHALLGITDGFALVNTSYTVDKQRNHSVFIRDVEWNQKNNKQLKAVINSTDLRLPYQHNNIIFRFSSNFFESNQDVMYRTKLIGDDDRWTDWSTTPIKEYTNIKEGDYTFVVQSKNHYGELSNSSEYRFTVLPPMYRSIWAKISYFVLAALLIWFTVYKIRESVKKRINTIREKHKLRTLEAQIEIINLRNSSLESDLIHRSKELTNSTYNIIHNNEILTHIKEQLKQVSKEQDPQMRAIKIKKIVNFIDKNLNSEKIWEIFESNFNRVHEDFFKDLKQRYPLLTQNDLRLCAYLKMNKNSKEIASLMNISIRGVESARYRLRKKMGLDKDNKTFDSIFLDSVDSVNTP